MYLYKTKIFHDDSKVVGLPSWNDAAVTDFEANHKSSVLDVNALELQDTTFVLDYTYNEFSDAVENNTTWGSVKCHNDGASYTLYLLTTNPLS